MQVSSPKSLVISSNPSQKNLNNHQDLAIICKTQLLRIPRHLKIPALQKIQAHQRIRVPKSQNPPFLSSKKSLMPHAKMHFLSRLRSKTPGTLLRFKDTYCP